MEPIQKRWWKETIVYQIYPSSFKDSNADGLGDIPGITSKLEYIQSLGADTIWLSPMYDSPMVDMGYDIRDYEKIHAPFGNLEDMMSLINETHNRGMKICLDLVINHTSDQHDWFRESRSSKENPKRDWYIWRPAKYDHQGKRMPPNNWRSCFSQPAWTWDEQTQEYYLHLFAPEQPDLNWEVPATRAAIYDSPINFWLSRGVDAWRIDTVNFYSKPDLSDVEITDPTRHDQPASHKFINGPRIPEYLREMSSKAFQKHGDIMTVGEAHECRTREQALASVRLSDPQLSMAFHFEVAELGTGIVAGKPKFELTPIQLSEFKRKWTDIQMFVAGTDAWTTTFLENHDLGRSVSRYADDSPEFWERSCKLLATLLSVSTGTLFLYQGQEIGMTNAPSSWSFDEFLDIETRNYIKFVEEGSSGRETDMGFVKQGLHKLARDHARLPMQWDDSQYAGFSSVKPWMRVHDAYKEINVASQERNPDSVLNFWRDALKMRKQHANLFVYGEVEIIGADDEETFVFIKYEPGNRTGRCAIIALNFTAEDQNRNALEDILIGEAKLLSCNYKSAPTKRNVLRPWESRVYLLCKVADLPRGSRYAEWFGESHLPGGFAVQHNEKVAYVSWAHLFCCTTINWGAVINQAQFCNAEILVGHVMGGYGTDDPACCENKAAPQHKENYPPITIATLIQSIHARSDMLTGTEKSIMGAWVGSCSYILVNASVGEVYGPIVWYVDKWLKENENGKLLFAE